ncbi:glycine cleavage system protein R [Sutterella sp.]|uniref:glycine cleavage system protein R n=1 Tax=Sutterella sp. TaxID=1981025 RepID=UPI0026E0C26A|nr:ACT domain-containing protein [Sutterella sp.]MDO5530531.1 ACT domain-containing protein [Sutterella sp.]
MSEVTTDRVLIGVFGLDRPGIVSTVSAVITRFNSNLEQVSQVTLHGQFALMCVVQKPADLSREVLEEALKEEIHRRKLNQAVMIADFVEPPAPMDGEPYVISVYGPDRNDIITTFSKILAEQRINIESLRAFPIEDGQSLQVFETMIPMDVDRRALHRTLIDRAQHMGLRCNLQHRDIFEAIHRVKVE